MYWKYYTGGSGLANLTTQKDFTGVLFNPTTDVFEGFIESRSHLFYLVVLEIQVGSQM